MTREVRYPAQISQGLEALRFILEKGYESPNVGYLYSQFSSQFADDFTADYYRWGLCRRQPGPERYLSNSTFAGGYTTLAP
jgi:hypothetical protein